MRISILLEITRISLNNVKVRCIGKDEYVYNSYVRNMIGRDSTMLGSSHSSEVQTEFTVSVSWSKLFDNLHRVTLYVKLYSLPSLVEAD